MFLTKDWLDPVYEITHLETQLRSLAVYHELLDVFNSVLPSLLIYMFDPKVSDVVDNLIELVSDSFDIYNGKATETDKEDTG